MKNLLFRAALHQITELVAWFTELTGNFLSSFSSSLILFLSSSSSFASIIWSLFFRWRCRAVGIDEVSRVIFPFGFTVFNISYWLYYLTIVSVWDIEISSEINKYFQEDPTEMLSMDEMSREVWENIIIIEEKSFNEAFITLHILMEGDARVKVLESL